MSDWRIECGDALTVLKGMEAGSVHEACTSPPYYGLRRYGGGSEEIGTEDKPDCLGWATRTPCGSCYVCRLVAVGEGVRRVLRDDGTFWLNLGSSYSDGKSNLQEGGGNEGLIAAEYNNDPIFVLRDDLSPDELAYVLSSLGEIIGKGAKV